MTRIAHALASVVLVATLATLAACGGGGGADSSSSSGTGSGGGATGGSSAGTTPVTPGPVPALGATRQGEGTFYVEATGDGSCMFGSSPGDMLIAAMNAPDYSGANVCGEFAEVTGPKGKVTVRIVDRCPECKSGDLDFSPQAFDRIADRSAGRVPITWKVVAGDVQGPVSYRYKEGSSQFWVAIQVRNHRVPVTKLEILPAGASSWIDVARAEYNYFIHPTPIAAGPLQVRVTALTGATVQNILPAPQGGLVVTGTAQFP